VVAPNITQENHRSSSQKKEVVLCNNVSFFVDHCEFANLFPDTMQAKPKHRRKHMQRALNNHPIEVGTVFILEQWYRLLRPRRISKNIPGGERGGW
jgi:hypothetical protein